MVNFLGKERFSRLSSVAVYRHPCTRKTGRDKKAGNVAVTQEFTVGKLVSLNEQSANVRPRKHNRFILFFTLCMWVLCVVLCVYMWCSHMSVWMYVPMHIYVRARGRHRASSSPDLNYIVLRQGLSWNQKFTILARLTSQWVSRMSPSLPPNTGVTGIVVTDCYFLHVCRRFELRSLPLQLMVLCTEPSSRSQEYNLKTVQGKGKDSGDKIQGLFLGRETIMDIRDCAIL